MKVLIPNNLYQSFGSRWWMKKRLKLKDQQRELWVLEDTDRRLPVPERSLSFSWQKDKDLSGIGSLRSASSRTQSSRC